MSTPAILTLSCPDKPGIVAAVSGLLAGLGCNIVDSAQFGDAETGRFFMRISFAQCGKALDHIREAFAPIAVSFAMDWQISDGSGKVRTLLMVSRFGHCLNDLLYRASIGSLPIEVPAIASNHPDLAPLAAAHGIAFHHIPVNKDGKVEAEARLAALIEDERCELIVLARYMQVLSNEFCADRPGRIINIHHSFLPSFKGAKPYHQAHTRGVKLIGATAHYVTADLDEGPIIEQDVARAHHGLSADALVAAGRDVESLVLARAVKWHAEHRVLLNGNRTVVFT